MQLNIIKLNNFYNDLHKMQQPDFKQNGFQQKASNNMTPSNSNDQENLCKKYNISQESLNFLIQEKHQITTATEILQKQKELLKSFYN